MGEIETMYHMLVIDDEPLILESLCQMILKKRKNQFYLFKATNAKEALEILKVRHVDIMMTDICMPGMDGIQLRDIVREYWPDCQTIFLTGQAEFAFAKEAVTSGTISYILKTEGDEAILGAIDSAFGRLEKMYAEKAEMLKLHRELRESIPVLKKECLKSIFYAERWNQESIAEISDKIKVVSPEFCLDRPFVIVMADLEKESGVMEQEAIRMLLEENIPGNVQKISAFLEKNVLGMLLQRGDLNLALVREFMDISMNLCEKANYKKPDIYIYGEPVTIECAAEAYYFLNYKRIEMGCEEGISLCLPERNEKKTEIEEAVLQKILDREQIDDCLIHLEKEKYYELLESAFAKGERNGSLCQAGVYMEASAALIKAVFLYLPQGQSCLDERKLQKLENYQYHRDFREALKFVEEISESYFNEREQLRMTFRDSLVQKVNHYIEENLSRDVSLVSIGDAMGLSPAYVSKLYRENAGISLNKYIVGRRISYAKTLLADETIRMQTIADMTGLRSASYFTHYFKRYTGYTPQAFRKDVLGQTDEMKKREEKKET